MLKKISISIICCMACTTFVQAQVQKDSTHTTPKNSLTPAQKLIASSGEDLLTGGNAHTAQTVISGYGEINYQHDFKYKNATIDMARAVLFVGHQFSKNIAFFSELEVEHAKVEGGGSQGTVGMEQAYVKFSLNSRQYIVAGLFLPRIGILNENHLPINYNGTERPLVEQLIIPSTWREVGIGFYGQPSTLPISYSVAVMSGLNATKFEHGSGLIAGRSEGQLASGSNLALTASLKAFTGDFQFQLSGYMGGTVGLGAYQADSLGLQSGTFGTPIYLGEADIQYDHGGFAAKALGSYISYPKAKDINRAYANNTPEAMYGAYGELSYDLLYNTPAQKESNRHLVAFVRYENLDMNAKIPTSGITDPTLKQWHLVTGLSYFPIPNLVIKADVRLTHTGQQNKALIINPAPVMQPYQQDNQFLNIGLGYAF